MKTAFIISFFLIAVHISTSSQAAECTDFSGTYVLQSDDSDEFLTILQNGCTSAQAVYEYGYSGHNSQRQLIFDGIKRPFVDDDSYFFAESFRIENQQILTEKEYHYKHNSTTMYVKGKIYLDKGKNFVEEELYFDQNGKPTTDKSYSLYLRK